MAGKRAKPGQKENRGGVREGAGRPKGSARTLSSQNLAAANKAAQEYAEKHGKNLWEIALEWIHDEEVSLTFRGSMWEKFMKLTMPVVKEGGEADQAAGRGPAFYLPEKRPELEAVPKDGDYTKSKDAA